MNFRIFIFTVFVAGLSCQIAFTDVSIALDQLDSYNRAVNSGDKEQIQAAYQEIVNTPETVEYLKVNMPRNYLKVRAQGLLNQLEAIEPADESRLSNLKTQQKTKLKPAPLPIQEIALPPKTNGEIVLERANIPLVDNQVYALNNPNQNRRSNQDILSSRLDRLYRQIQERFQ